MTEHSFAIQKKYGRKAIDIVHHHVKTSEAPVFPSEIHERLTRAQVHIRLSTVYTSLMKLKAKGLITQDELRGPYYAVQDTPAPRVKEVDMALEKPDAEYLYICNHSDQKVSVFPASELLTLADERYFNDGDELIHVQVKCRKKVKLETIVKTRFLPVEEE